MKTTIKTVDGEKLTVQPMRISKSITLDATDKHGHFVSLCLSPDQIGVLLYALESEMEAMGVTS